MISVLYVDDEEALLEIGKLYLEKTTQFRVDILTSAPAAIEKLTSTPYDAVVSDYQMPGMDGIEFLKIIRKNHPTLPFIIFTGKGREDVAIQAFENGADFYVQKGGEPKAQFAELAHKILRAVQHRTDEKSLMESEERFHALVENTSDVIRILDREGRIVFETAAAGRELGYPPGYTLGRHPFEFIHPDDLAVVKQDLSEVYAKTSTSVPTEFRIRKADGSYVWAEAIGKNLIGVPGVDGIVVTTRIIEDRRKAEVARRESEEKFRQLFSKMPSGVAIYDAVDDGEDFIFRDFNSAGEAIEHIKKENAIGRRVSEVFPGVKEFGLFSVFQRVWRTGKPEFFPSAVYRDVREPGTWRENWVYRLQTGEVVAIYNDITERKVAEQAVTKSQSQLAEAMDLAHMVNWEFDVASGIFTFNDRFYALYGTTAEREGGYQMPADVYAREFVHPYEVGLVAREVQNAITATDPNYTRDIEHRIIRRDGEIRYILVRFGITKDAKGRTVKTHGANQDITNQKKAEEALQASEERFRNIYSQAAEGILIADIISQKFLYANPAICKMLGYSAQELTSIGMSGIHPEKDLAHVQEEFMAQARGEKTLAESIPVLRKDGVIRYMDIRTTPVIIDGHCCNLGMFTDITERRQAEEALRIVNEKYTKAFLSAPDAITISELDSGRFIEVNDAATRIFGYSRDELIGKSALELGIIINKGDREHLIDQVRKNGKVSHFEILERRKSGELYYALVNADTLFIENIPHLITTVRDITDRKQIEEALRESSRKLQEAQEMAHLGFWSWDVKTGRVEWSDEVFRIFGLDPKEFTPQIDSILALSPWPVDQQRDKELIRRAIESRESGTYEQRFLRPDNSTGYYYSTFQGRYDDGNNLISIVGTVLDITERKLVEEELQVTKEKYTKAFLSVPDAITISELESGRFIEVNDAASTLFGYTRDELVNKSGIDLGIWVNNEERDALIDQIKKEGRVVQFRVAERRKSGELFNASITADTITIGNTRYLIAATRDITKRKQMEEALRESETRYKNIVEDQTEFISRFLPDGTHVFVNAAYCRYFKKTREEIIGHRFTPDIPEEDKKIVREHFQSLTPDNPVASVDHRIIMPDGSVHWQRWSNRAIFNNTGKIVEYQSVGRDITETKLVERELKNSEHLRQDIIDHLPDPTFVINAQGIVIAWNKAMEELAGVPARDMIGKGNYEYALPFYGVRQPILIDLALHYDEEVWKKYDSIQRDGKTLVAETTNARPHGQPAVLWGKASPVYDENGRLIGAIETIRNITDRKRMENGLRESEERYSSIFDNNYSVSLLIDPDTGKIVDANAAAVRYYGYSHDELTDRGIYDLNRLPQNKVVRDLQQAEHEKAKHFFSTHYLASGKKRNVEIYSGPITIQGKSYFYSIIHDITERKQAEEALALASKKLSLLSSITRHDILNQLTVLRGYIDLSEDMLNDPVKMREFLEKEETAAATIEEQITFTKEYQEMGVSAPSWQNVNAKLKKAQKQFLMRDVRVDVDCTDLEVYADPLFEKVFYNLIDNALRYGGDGMKAIRVHYQESNSGLVITCEDDGVGITQEDKKRLFTRGFGKHTGLGLFLTREILGITGITITENGIPGKGARFEITVPKGAYRFTGIGEK